MHVTHDRVLVDGCQSRGAWDWLPSLPFGGGLECLMCAVASGYVSLARWSSRLLGSGIRVSPMSSAWLHMNELEHRKHRPEM
jgi:hypothetical protein